MPKNLPASQPDFCGSLIYRNDNPYSIAAVSKLITSPWNMWRIDEGPEAKCDPALPYPIRLRHSQAIASFYSIPLNIPNDHLQPA